MTEAPSSLLNSRPPARLVLADGRSFEGVAVLQSLSDAGIGAVERTNHTAHARALDGNHPVALGEVLQMRGDEHPVHNAFCFS